MGFSNWLKNFGKSQKQPAFEVNEDEFVDEEYEVEESAGPERPQLYFFQHKVLPEAVFSNHPELMKEINEGVGSLPLLHFWSKAELSCHLHGFKCDEEFSPFEEIHRHTSNIGEYTFYIYSMPEPKFPVELYFAGIVHRNSGPKEYMQESVGTCYFTLEKAEEAPAMFCEWTADGQHNNFGDVSDLSLENFIAAISARVNVE